MAAEPSGFVNNHLANERTFLAYLRTAVSLMSFGIAINRFSLFLLQSKDGSGSQSFLKGLVHSEQVGIGMVTLGMGLLAWAAGRYKQVFHQIERQDYRPQPRDVLILTGLVLIGALVGVVWLFMG